MDNKTYIGITIGPIFETMDLVSSPAALWASSYIFSFVTKEICRFLIEKGINKENIISPYYDPADSLPNDGVGRYPDRIIFVKPSVFEIDTIKDIKKEVIASICTNFFGEVTIKSEGQLKSFKTPAGVEQYLAEHLMIEAVEYSINNSSENNPILLSGKILDCIELSKPFIVSEKTNFILDRFTGANDNEGNEQKKQSAKGKNDLIKAVATNLGIKDWQLLQNDRIKDIPSIAKVDNTSKKYNNYCVIVRADGDNVSKIIQHQTDDEKIRLFSKNCLDYCAAAAELVRTFGGVTIYSGGDDLLALLPCMGEIEGSRNTILNFCKKLNKTFNDKFEKYREEIENENNELSDEKKIPLPSLSIAAFIFYKKFPLYEAVDYSAHLLFDVAKKTKNCCAISLQKHAGQSVELIIPSGAYDDVISLQDSILKGEESESNDKDEILLSALQKIAMFDALLTLEREKTEIANLFANLFDSSSHKDNNFVHNILPDYFFSLGHGENYIRSTQQGEKYAEQFAMLLRLMKFFAEKGDE